MQEVEKRSLYGWAFSAGLKLLERYEELYGPEKAGKRMETLLLTLRSELLPERFRRALVDAVIEVNPDILGLPEEIKVEKRWKAEEFYIYSTAILSGFFDALVKWGRERKAKKEDKEGEKKEKGEGYA